MSRFDECLAFTWRPDFDGQPLHFTAHDHGGATAWGVTLSAYAAWRAKTDLRPTTAADLGCASKDELAQLIRVEYWDAVRGDDLPSGVDLLVYDFGYGSGPGTSARLLQEVLGVEVDGELGPQSLGAAQSPDRLDLIRRLGDRHDAYYRSLAQYPLFGRGWSRRNTARVQIALNTPASSDNSTRAVA